MIWKEGKEKGRLKAVPPQTPCCVKGFEPLVQKVGFQIILLGFSIHVELAHRYQCGLPVLYVFGQRHHTITHTTGVLKFNLLLNQMLIQFLYQFFLLRMINYRLHLFLNSRAAILTH